MLAGSPCGGSKRTETSAAHGFRTMFRTRLGGFISKEQTAETAPKPDCPLIGQDGNIFNLMGIASRTLKQNGLADQAKEMCDRIRESGDYYKALGVIGEYVNITSVDDAPDEGEEFEEGMGMQL